MIQLLHGLNDLFEHLGDFVSFGRVLDGLEHIKDPFVFLVRFFNSLDLVLKRIDFGNEFLINTGGNNSLYFGHVAYDRGVNITLSHGGSAYDDAVTTGDRDITAAEDVAVHHGVDIEIAVTTDLGLLEELAPDVAVSFNVALASALHTGFELDLTACVEHCTFDVAHDGDVVLGTYYGPHMNITVYDDVTVKYYISCCEIDISGNIKHVRDGDRVVLILDLAVESGSVGLFIIGDNETGSFKRGELTSVTAGKNGT